MKIAIVGSRSFQDYDAMCSFIEEKLTAMEHPTIEAVVSGGARGADTLAEHYAQERGLHMVVFPAAWKKYGRRAGFIRNVDIIRECDVCFAFWNGKSHGTKHDIELCEQMDYALDITDDSYTTLDGDEGYMPNHSHPYVTSLFPVRRKVPYLLRKKLERGLEKALKENETHP